MPGDHSRRVSAGPYYNDYSYIHPDDCNKYLVCLAGFPFKFTCPDGGTYDEAKRRCDASRQCNKPQGAPVVNRCPPIIPRQPVPDHFSYPLPGECQRYIYCDHGWPVERTFPDGHVFSEISMGCVDQNSSLDRCTNRALTSDSICPPGSTELVTHPDFCQRYYNCSDTSSRRYSFLKPYENECKYPDLFDYVSKTCKTFEQATCLPGTHASVGVCEYMNNRCFSYCRLCNHSSCENRPDGIHEDDYYKYKNYWTSDYMRCYKNRSIEFFQCGSTPADSNIFDIFSRELKTCVPAWDIPRNFGGLQPDCSAKLQGRLYVTEESDRVYYKCPFSKVSVCDDGQVFSEERQTCVEA